MPHVKYIVLGIFNLFAGEVLAQEEKLYPKFIFDGYIKELQSIQCSENFDQTNSVNLLHNRLNLKMNFTKNLTARVDIRNRIYTGNLPPYGFGKIIDQYDGYIDLSLLWADEPDIVIHSVADRCFVKYNSAYWDITIGRQRINWGINTIWNPNDIFNAYNFLDFDYEERAGNDAIRMQHYFKNNNTIEGAYKPGKNNDEDIGAVLYKFNKVDYDFQILSGICLTDYAAGAGWAGGIRKTGLKGELMYFQPRHNFSDTSGELSLSVTLDRTFKNDWYVSVSGLYNSKPEGLFIAGTQNESSLNAKSLFPFRYSFYAGAMHALSPITSINFAVVYSPTYKTTILFPSFAWNAANNFDVDVSVQSFFAETSEQYKNQLTTFFIRTKWSF